MHIEVDALFSLLLPGSDRSREDRMLAYDAAHLLARMLLARGRSVSLECTYARVEQRASLLAALADAAGAPLWVVELHVSPDEAVQRFRGRREPTDLDEESLRERVAAFPYSGLGLRLSSSGRTPVVLAGDVAKWLRGRPGSVDKDAWARAGRDWD